MQESQDSRVNKPKLDRNQKLAIFVLAVFGFFIIVMWMVQFRNSLIEPFQYKGSASSTDEAALTASSTDEALKNKDTDGDGLSDWDELNIYHSSPYLFSTAGDGVSDGVKVQKGEDPRCPENNQNCMAASEVIASSTATLDSSFNTTSTLVSLPSQTSTTTSSFQPNLNVGSSTDDASLQTMLNGQMNAASLRQTLLNSGMDPKVLGQMSDQVLLQNYQSVLKNNSSSQ